MERLFFFVERQQEADALWKKPSQGQAGMALAFWVIQQLLRVANSLIDNLLPLGKQKQAFGKNLIYNWIRRTSTMFLIPSTVTDNTAKIISQR